MELGPRRATYSHVLSALYRANDLFQYYPPAFAALLTKLVTLFDDDEWSSEEPPSGIVSGAIHDHTCMTHACRPCVCIQGLMSIAHTSSYRNGIHNKVWKHNFSRDIKWTEKDSEEKACIAIILDSVREKKENGGKNWMKNSTRRVEFIDHNLLNELQLT